MNGFEFFRSFLCGHRADPPAQIELRALVERSEDGQDWEAICLEMDLIANGATPKEAVTELVSVIEAHLAYAEENGCSESVWFPAPAEYWQRFFGKASVEKGRSMPVMSPPKAATSAALEYRELVPA